MGCGASQPRHEQHREEHRREAVSHSHAAPPQHAEVVPTNATPAKPTSEPAKDQKRANDRANVAKPTKIVALTAAEIEVLLRDDSLTTQLKEVTTVANDPRSAVATARHIDIAKRFAEKCTADAALIAESDVGTYVAQLRAAFTAYGAEDSPSCTLEHWLRNELPASAAVTEHHLDHTAAQGATIALKFRRIARLLGAETKAPAYSEKDTESADPLVKEWALWLERLRSKVLERPGATNADADREVAALHAAMTVDKDSPWVRSLHKHSVAPSRAVEYLFAVFLYTVDHKSPADDIPPTSLATFLQLPKDEVRRPAEPKDTALLGWNAAGWAVVNWLLRVGYPLDSSDAALAAVAERAQALLPVYAPFIETLEEALHCLPKARRVVFRGVPVALATKFKLDSQVVFPPFTSTSLVGREALNFMDANKPGTFFLLHTHSGAMVNFASWYPEQAESLLSTFSAFRVKSKMSKSILQMLGREYDIVTVAEEGGVATDDEAAQALLDAAAQTTFVYDGYLRTYVESRVGPLPITPANATVPLFAELDAWIGDSSGTRHLLLLGSGGSGKTSATLAALSHFAAHPAKGVHAVLVPLPQVAGLLTESGALDRHLLRTLELTEAQLRVLAAKRTLVLFLDSLDEVGELPLERLRDGGGLLAGNPLTASLARVVLSCRDEALASLSAPAAVLVGQAAATNEVYTRYVQPFSDADRDAYASKVLGDEPDEGKRTMIMELLKTLQFAQGVDVTHHPLTLTMLLSVLRALTAEQLNNTHATMSTRATLYEAFLQMRVSTSPAMVADVDAALTAMSSVALDMLRTGRWATTVGAAKAVLHAVAPEADDTTIRAWLRAVPSRVEDINDDASAHTFWHKSLGEYLCARQLHRASTAALAATSTQPWSLNAPLVLAMFGELCLDRSEQSKAALAKLTAAVTAAAPKSDPNQPAPTPAHPNYSEIVTTSNAAALLAAAGRGAELDLSSKHLWRCNLRGVQLGRVAYARLEDCAVHGARLLNGEINDSCWPGTTAGLPLPPMVAPDSLGALCVAWSSCGRWIAAGYEDFKVRIWAADSGELKSVLSGHSNIVTDVSWSNDSLQLVSGSRDKTVRVFCVVECKELAVLRGHEKEVNSVHFSPCGTKIASGSDDHTARVFSAVTYEQLAVLTNKNVAVQCVRWSPSGDKLVYGGIGANARIWVSGDDATMVTSHRGDFRGISWAPDGQKILFGGAVMSIIDATTRNQLREWYFESGNPTSVAWSPDGKQIAVGSVNSSVVVYDANTLSVAAEHVLHGSHVRGVDWSPDSTRTVSASADATLRVCDAVGSYAATTRPGHTGAVDTATISHDKKRIASADKGWSVRIWDIVGGVQLAVLQACDFAYWSPDDTRLLTRTANYPHSATVWDSSTYRSLATLNGGSDVHDAKWSPNGAMIAVATSSGVVKIFDSESYKLIGELQGHSGDVFKIAWSSDSNKLISASKDSTSRIWDTTSFGVLKVLTEPLGLARSVTFSPDNKLVATLSGSEVRVWSAIGGTQLHVLSHDNTCYDVAWSPDGSLLAVSTFEGVVKMYDTSNFNKEPMLLKGHRAKASTSWSRSGTTLVTCSWDKSIIYWQCKTLFSLRFEPLLYLSASEALWSAPSKTGRVKRTNRDEPGLVHEVEAKK